MEVLLALSVIVALGAIAWPALRGPLAQARLRGGAQQLQSAFGSGRLLAMSLGETCVVRFTMGTNEYRLEPLSAGDPALTDENALLDAQQAQLNSKHWTLPKDVVFANQELVSDERSQTSDMQMQQRQNSYSTGAAESRIFFYPDGTSSTARVILAHQASQTASTDQVNQQMGVELRGLTGMARIVNVEVVQ